MRDKVVVTGAASGIGAALCRRFGSEGAWIALLDMDEAGLDARVRELSQKGIKAFGQVCDVTDQEQCMCVMQEIIHRFGGIDVLINNAGITQRCPFTEANVSMYRRVMDINFFGAVHCTTAAIESLIKHKGRIIVISSIAGLTPVLGRTGYSASKHALHGFFGTLRAEMRPNGVHVMIVCPGFTRTNLQQRALDGDGSVTKHPQSKVGRQASPEDVAAAVYRGVVKGRNLLVLTAVGKVSYLVHRISSGLYERIMERGLRKELER